MSKLRLPWGEELVIEEDIEHLSMDVMGLTAEYYVDSPLMNCQKIIVRSQDFLTVEGDTIIVRACSVSFIEIWSDEEEDPEFEKKWQDFMLDHSPPKEEQ